MIVRTYQRRNRVLGRSLNDPGVSFADVESLGDSCSQESPWSSSQERFSFPSSQDSSWSPIENGTAVLDASFSHDKHGHGGVKFNAPTDSAPSSSQLSCFSLKRLGFDNTKRKADERPSPGQKLMRAESSLTKVQFKDVTKKSSISFADIEGKKLNSSKAGLCGDTTILSAAGERQEYEASFKSTSVWGPFAPPTSTLMEAQESGEMMEHVDEANFAIDGLRPGQPLRIQRASLVSLLSICGSMQRRRLLRTHGIAQPVLDAVIALSTDDPPTALGAAALLYLLASDGQNENLLDSSVCIEFLMKILYPCSTRPDGKFELSAGISSVRTNAKSSMSKVDMKCAGADHGGAAIVAKVNSLLRSMKDGAAGSRRDNEQSGQLLEIEELTSHWLALRTLEKACLSTVILEDNSGSVKTIGGHFKERLRELGGLDTICDLVASCFVNLRTTLNDMSSARKNFLSVNGSRGVGMLLRCLKVMENVTFLSEKNQRHLLDMRLHKETYSSPSTFIGLVVDVIKALSELVLSHKNGKTVFGGYGSMTQIDRNAHHTSNVKVEKIPHGGLPSIKDKFPGNLSQSKKYANTTESIQLHKKLFLGSNPKLSEPVEQKDLLDSEDPFDFDNLDAILMKGASKKNLSKTESGEVISNTDFLDDSSKLYTFLETANISETEELGRKYQEPIEYLNEHTQQSILLGDCLLSAVKVLMNLTNDNPIGCLQVAACGGLDAMVSLIVGHYPFLHSRSAFLDDQRKVCGKFQVGFSEEANGMQPEQDLDLLVVVLGVLVNLVEKDAANRSRLVTLHVDAPSHLMTSISATGNCKGMISLLCSIFMSKEGSGAVAEVTGDKLAREIDDEAMFRQGQREAEDMIVEAYAALLLAFLSKQSDAARSAIAANLPGNDLNTLVPVLERFVAFHLSLNMITSETHAVVRDVIESCKQPL